MVHMSVVRVLDPFLLSRDIRGMGGVLRNSSILESSRSTINGYTYLKHLTEFYLGYYEDHPKNINEAFDK